MFRFAVEHKLQVLHEKETGKKCITDEMHEKF